MNIAVITTSHREGSASRHVANHIQKTLEHMLADSTASHVDLIDLSVLPLPFFQPANAAECKRRHAVIFEQLRHAHGIILITPEWDGMAAPAAKNLMIYLHDGEVAHKPGLLVAVSSGINGAYPIADMRMTSYKNNFINWIPLHLIFRMQETEAPRLPPQYEPTIRAFLAYCEAISSIRPQIVEIMRDHTYGM